MRACNDTSHDKEHTMLADTMSLQEGVFADSKQCILPGGGLVSVHTLDKWLSMEVPSPRAVSGIQGCNPPQNCLYTKFTKHKTVIEVQTQIR